MNYIGWFLLSISLFTCTAALAEPVRVGKDIAYFYTEDEKSSYTFEEFLSIPESELIRKNSLSSIGYTSSALWVKFRLPSYLFKNGERWLELGPNFVDEFTVYYRSEIEGSSWVKRDVGDRVSQKRSDIHNRFPVLVLPDEKDRYGQPFAYTMVFRVASTSAVMFDAKLWTPQKFTEHVSSENAFWSFYFGLAFVSTVLALTLAIILKTRLFWSIFLFSLNFILVAAVQGYIAWILGPSGINIQHYLTSILTLLGYTSLLWMCTEVLDIKRKLPILRNIFISAIILNLLLQLSIPLGFYGLAIELQGLFLVVTAIMFLYATILLWIHEKPGFVYIFVGFSPFIYLVCTFFTLLTLYGLIPYSDNVYISWQYMLLVNMILVIWLALDGILQRNKEMREKEKIEYELKLVKEKSFHQRQFIGVVSHEFRTPLSIISSAIQNLQLLGGNDQITKRYLKIQRAVNRLTQLADNCLADARLDATSIKLQIESFELGKLISECMHFLDLSENNDVFVRFNNRLIPIDSMPCIPCLADRGMLKIAISNILDNAVKYSAKSLIHLDIEQLNGELNIYIQDEGPGIPESQAEEVFKRYRRLDVPQKGSIGTGLGLYVSREIVQAHGGDIKLMTYQPESCRFKISLPNKNENYE
jgi:signal transduction histidine kinase